MNGSSGFGVKLHLGVFLCSVAVLLFQMTQIRYFGFSLPPILAYAGISLAMTGFGIGAMLLSIRPGLVDRDPGVTLPATALLFCGSAVLSAVSFATSSWNAVLGLENGNPVLIVLGVLLPGILPYFFGGLFTAIVFSRARELVGRVYFWNLLGAGLGAMLITLLLRPLGAERVILVAAILGAVSALLIALPKSKALGGLSVAVIVVSMALLPVADKVFQFAPDPVDAVGHPLLMAQSGKGPQLVNHHSEWNIVARIDAWEHVGAKFKVPEPIDFRVLTVDSGAVTVFLGDPGRPKWGGDLFGKTLYGAAYVARPAPQDVLIIGAGGGTDVQTALYNDAKDIVGVEINRSTIAAVQGPFADFLAWPKSEAVHLVHGDGRGFVKAPGKKFDVIQMSGVDTITIVSTGAFNMVEETLYTIDAFEDYLRALKPGGLLSVLRFGTEHLRLAAIAAAALERVGIENPENHVVSLRQSQINSVLVSLRPFTSAELDGIEQWIRGRGQTALSIPPYELHGLDLNKPIEPVYIPGRVVQPRFGTYFKNLKDKGGERTKAISRLSLPTDDNPFFMLTGLLTGSWQILAPVQNAVRLMEQFWAAIVVLALVLIVVPVVVVRRGLRSYRPLAWVFPYFFFIGMCFMLLEVGIINWFAPFVGSPGASMSVVLTSLLVFTGVGAYLSSFDTGSPVRRILVATGALLLVAVLVRIAHPILFDKAWSAGFGQVARGVVAGLILAPLGVCLGFFFPAGLAAISRFLGDEHLAPWAISVNAFASVLGSIAALPMALFLGFDATFGIALAGYFLAGAISVVYFRRQKV
jgi:SAM-dependent methyltransferase